MFALGCLAALLTLSVSVALTLLVPLAAKGYVDRREAMPYIMGANITTLAVYGALGAGLFLVVLRLQVSLGYSPLAAGASLVPFTGLMLVLSPSAGQLGQRAGARLPMTVGPLVTSGGMLLFSRISPGDHYATAVLPAVIVFGLGMALTVAPLTAAVFGGVTDDLVGIASGVNNAVARLAGLLAVAILPAPRKPIRSSSRVAMTSLAPEPFG